MLALISHDSDSDLFRFSLLARKLIKKQKGGKFQFLGKLLCLTQSKWSEKPVEAPDKSQGAIVSPFFVLYYVALRVMLKH